MTALKGILMNSVDIVLSNHAKMQMLRRRIIPEDIFLVLRLGIHVDGKEEDTLEACIDLEGRPLTVVYDARRFEEHGLFYIVTVLRRWC